MSPNPRAIKGRVWDASNFTGRHEHIDSAEPKQFPELVNRECELANRAGDSLIRQ